MFTFASLTFDVSIIEFGVEVGVSLASVGYLVVTAFGGAVGSVAGHLFREAVAGGANGSGGSGKDRSDLFGVAAGGAVSATAQAFVTEAFKHEDSKNKD